ncbi:hypothetical protein [Streptomyces sp. NRRL S-1022]|uniref:hypothetical protein n=1 Tax=Streptomyces sp. NRRL S-1022 TaxID=1463880 RepID=UPI000AD04D54|nr:hypothetical protein [Streptomyces sp. NRRL S-1022]
MKLGKALATGVAEERPLARLEPEEEPRSAEETVRVEADAPAEPVREEVPAAR